MAGVEKAKGNAKAISGMLGRTDFKGDAEVKAMGTVGKRSETQQSAVGRGALGVRGATLPPLGVTVNHNSGESTGHRRLRSEPGRPPPPLLFPTGPPRQVGRPESSLPIWGCWEMVGW